MDALLSIVCFSIERVMPSRLLLTRQATLVAEIPSYFLRRAIRAIFSDCHPKGSSKPERFCFGKTFLSFSLFNTVPLHSLKWYNSQRAVISAQLRVSLGY